MVPINYVQSWATIPEPYVAQVERINLLIKLSGFHVLIYYRQTTYTNNRVWASTKPWRLMWFDGRRGYPNKHVGSYSNFDNMKKKVSELIGVTV